MRFEQVRSLLDHTREFHRRLAEHYAQLSSEDERQRVRMLLDYVAHLERTIEEAVGHFEEDGPRLVLDTWLDCAAGETFRTCLERLIGASEVSIDSVVAEVLDMHGRVVTAFEGIATGSVPPAVADLLEDVIALEKSQGRRLARAVGRMEDM